MLEPISFYVKVFTPDFYMGMHNHGYFEFMYAEKGSFTIETMTDPDNPAQSETLRLPCIRANLSSSTPIFFTA